MFDRRVLLKYSLMQLPGFFIIIVFLCVAAHLFPVPGWFVLCLILFWVAKDIILFPVTWRSYIPSEDPIEAMKGQSGIALEGLSPRGYIRVKGERWLAELAGGADSIEKDGVVRIVGMRGLTLLVRPEDGEEDS